MNRNSKFISLYEKINNNEVLLQSLKAGDVFLCSKCQNFKSSDEFSKNQKWCKSCMKSTINTELITCECGRVVCLRSHNKHLISKYHAKRVSKENIPQN